jgi:anti-anti-sigma factor
MSSLRFSVQGDAVLIEILENIHSYAARELDTTLNSLVAQGHSRLVLDASQMGFISSAGLQAILSAQQQVCERGGGVRVCGLNAHSREIFELAGLDECLQLIDTCQEAMLDW